MNKVITNPNELMDAVRALGVGQSEAVRKFCEFENLFTRDGRLSEDRNDKDSQDILEMIDTVITFRIVVDYDVTAKECWDAVNFFIDARAEMYRAMFS